MFLFCLSLVTVELDSIFHLSNSLILFAVFCSANCLFKFFIHFSVGMLLQLSFLATVLVSPSLFFISAALSVTFCFIQLVMSSCIL